MNHEEYGKLMTSIITKLGLGLPLTEQESAVLYDFLMGQNTTIGMLMHTNSEQQGQIRAQTRQVARLKGVRHYV